MSDDETSRRRDVPPPVDLAGHLRDLAGAFVPALIVALLVGAAVFGLRTAFATKEYSASIVTQIVPAQQVVASDAFVEQLRAPFVGLAHDTDVLSEVVSSVDTGWDAATLDKHIATAPGSSPNVLIFTATAESPELAKQIVRSMVVTVGQAAAANRNRDMAQQVDELGAAIAAERARNDNMATDDPEKADSNKQLTDLEAQLLRVKSVGNDQLTVLATPEQSRAPVSPRPIYESMVAALAALIVAAESIVFLRGRVGSKPNTTWARRVARKYGASFDPADPTGNGLPAVAAAAVAYDQSAGRKVLILLGDKATFPQPALPPDAPPRSSDSLLITASMGSAWWRDVDLPDVATVMVVASTEASDRRIAERTLRQLRDLNLPTYLVLQPSPKTTQPATSTPRRRAKNHAS